jgi:hypothetical protein
VGELSAQGAEGSAGAAASASNVVAKLNEAKQSVGGETDGEGANRGPSIPLPPAYPVA